MRSAIQVPSTDPTAIFEIFRGSYGSELLTAAVNHLGVFGRLGKASFTLQELGQDLGLQPRPTNVLVTALRAFGLINVDEQGRLSPTEMAREHLMAGGAFYVGDYLGLAAQSPGVLEMVERLRTNRPAGAQEESGAAFIYRDGVASAMEQEQSARVLTMALAGRAKNVAPHLARVAGLEDANLLLDVAGGTGLYSISCLQRYPRLRAVVWDRPEVLKIASELADEYGVSSRLECVAGDMFTDALPTGADAVLLSNVLHDWDVPQCQELLGRCAAALPGGGRLLVHDVFLSDRLDGPLPVALYSAALFTLTEGRAYSAGEYRSWLKDCGLTPGEIQPTLIHCGVLPARKD